MSDHQTDVMDDYGLRLGQELRELSARALQPFDAAVIAHQVATQRARAGRPFGLAIALNAPRWMWLVVALATALLLAVWAVVGQQPSLPLTYAPGTIAFTHGSSLYLAAADGSHEVKIAPGDPNGPQIVEFTFASNGSALAFDDGNDSLVVASPNGRTEKSSPFDESSDAAPWFSWGPDGQQLVIGLGTDRPELAIIGVDGSTVRTLALPDGFSWGWLPDIGSWSPDGRWIAVHGCIQPCDIKFGTHVLLVAADGSGWQWLTTTTDMTGYTTTELWAPDSRLALANMLTGTVEILATDGSTDQTVSVPGLQGAMAWSPDGSRLAVGGTALTLVESDGTVHQVPIDGAVRQTGPGDQSAVYITHVGWSVDGKDVLFAGPTDLSVVPSGDTAPELSLYAIDPQGGTPRVVIKGVDGSFDVASPR